MFSNARQSAYRKSRGQRSLGFSGGFVSLPEPDGGTKYASGGQAGRNERWRENRAVFADLILTTCPGRVLPWNRFATAAVVYTGGGRVGRDVQEGSERAGERAFCNTSSQIYQTARKRGETHGGGGHWNEAVGSERGAGGLVGEGSPATGGPCTDIHFGNEFNPQHGHGYNRPEVGRSLATVYATVCKSRVTSRPQEAPRLTSV